MGYVNGYQTWKADDACTCKEYGVLMKSVALGKENDKIQYREHYEYRNQN